MTSLLPEAIQMPTIAHSGDTHIEPTPIKLTDTSFDSFVRGHPLVLVDVWAAWCPPCRRMAPIVEEVAREFAGKVTVAKLNTKENPATARRFAIRSIPTFILFKEGKVVEKAVGGRFKRALLALPEPYLSSPGPSGKRIRSPGAVALSVAPDGS